MRWNNLLAGLLLGLACRMGYADTKISAFPSTTTLNSVDIIPVVTNPGTAPANFSINKSSLSATLDILTNSSATLTYLQNSSATATYLQQSSATTTYGQLKSTQTWTGGNTFSSATFTLINGVTPGLVPGTNITSITGAWPNQTINATTQGGGGSSALAVSSGSATISVIVSSPTSNVVFDSNTFVGALQGTTTGVIYVSSAGVLYTSSATANYGQLKSTQAWTGGNTFSSETVTSLVVTSSAAIPTFSQNFGRGTLGQWFSQMGAAQTPFTPLAGNKLSIAMIGDSHTSKNVMTGPFIDWLYSNFGNAGTYFPLSDNGESDNTMRPNGCTYSKSGSWVTNQNSPTALGLDDDSMHTSTPTATILGTCPQVDTVILHYTKQPNGGTVDFSVDGANHMVLPTANGTTIVASATISGLTYGVHTASVSYTTAGTAGIDVLDWIFFSSSTPGAVVYRAGSNAQRADMYVAQNATQYQNLVAMLPSTPSVVAVILTVNDAATNIVPATFVSNVETIVQRFRNVYPNIDCVYVSEPDFLNSQSDTYSMSTYENALLQASVKDGCAFTDFTAYFSSFPYFSKYYSDTIHLNQQGGQVGAQLLINTFSNNVNTITPFTYSASSSVVTWGTDITTTSASNFASFGANIQISSGIANAGAIGTNLTVTKSNTFLIGGSPGSGTEETVSMSGISLSTYGVTGSYTAVSTNTVIMANCASNCTITLPTAVGIAGKLYRIKMLNAPSVTVTVATTGGQTIDGSTTQVLTLQYVAIDVISDGSNWEIF